MMSLQASRPAPSASDRQHPDAVSLVELLFFAYRDFVGEADRILERYGFGRAHHRVLHFVNRYPGLTVAELLTILGITKQSLSRVLKDLITDGLIEQQPGADRRQRLLLLTAQGKQLADDLLTLQVQRVKRAASAADERNHAVLERFLSELIDHDVRGQIVDLVHQRSQRGNG
jgi:DNA-binding MarR family transcriptional regulator